MEYISGTTTTLPKHQHGKLNLYRYQVFVELLGWEMDTPEGVELDEFDQSYTRYVIAKNSEQEIVGCARLLPTTESYLLEKIFPQLLGDMPAPKSADVWELSRFAAVDLNRNQLGEKQQFSPQITPQLIEEVMEHARNQGAKRLIGVCPIGVERSYRRLGYKTYRAGPAMVIDGYPLVACWVDLY